MKKLFNACCVIGLLLTVCAVGTEELITIIICGATGTALIAIGLGGRSYMEKKDYYCPVCGERVLEVVYVTNDGEVLGCENCGQIKEPWEMLKYEADRK